MSISITGPSSALGPERYGAQLAETITITGSTGAAGDTATYRPTHIHRNAQIVGGAFAITSAAEDLAGVTLTIKALVALGNDVVRVQIKGDM